MGVPKFYRWLSERYPCINENVNQYNMPEFDYFYVDMNGVFHICSHPSDDVHFRIPESQIFENIATYVNFLFHLVQPQKVFFLSVDGVAPRSKMNQQRSRRFKSAKEAIEKETRAKQMGETLPEDPRFDSNCITPGTAFMNRLHLFMLDFIAKQIQNSQEWREVEIIYSGYDVPGEGEHKIMDYIRYCKTQNYFDADTRHCLYGLDADLINLGLSTHEPYFSVLREEVSFGRNKQRHCDPIRTNFQLLHLSILRSYIYLEFQEFQDKLKFDFELEKIIDDWILINFLVGNDFLPHVPRLHINKNGIQILYDSYKAVLPTLDGYINNNGQLNLLRYQKFLTKLSEYDLNLFNQNNMDLKYLDEANDITFGCDIEMGEDFEFASDDELSSDSNPSTDSSENEIDDEFVMHKNNYYVTKMEFEDLSIDVPKIVFEYIKGIQWVLYYYFDGCMSWNWYYPYHYGPFISDLAKIDPTTEFHFEIGKPFQPLVQLLAVLPQASKEILPKAFQQLTYIPDSPLIDYFPKEFKTDLNEKIHDYEAIILIPFMDDKLLVETFEKYKGGLTSEEIARNKFGCHHSFKYLNEEMQQNIADVYDLERFPNVSDRKISNSHFILPREIIYKGLRRCIDLNAINGFPSLNGIDYTIKMEMARIKVFDFASQNLTMMIHVEEKCFTDETLSNLANRNIDKIVYINWPLLAEAKLIEINDENYKFQKNRSKQKISPEELNSAKISCRNHYVTLRNRRGIILDSVKCMAKVLTLQSQRYLITGGKVKLHKEWSKTALYVPLDLVICNVEQTFRKMPIYKSLKSVFTKNKSFYLIANPFYGYKAEVIKYIAKENMVFAKVCVNREPDFEEIQLQTEYIMDKNYMTEGKLAMTIKKQLSMPESIIRRLFGSVIISYETDKGRLKRFNLGLKLKYKSDFQKYCIPGYSNIYNNDIYYSNKVYKIFMEYYEMFPHVFHMLQHEHKSTYELDDLFSDDLSKSEKINSLLEIKNWLDSRDFAKIQHTHADADYIDNCVLKAIEERVESHMVFMDEENVFTEKISPASFYIPEFLLKGTYLPDPKVKFELFDRVVNVKGSIAVPFGAKGTVIGIYVGNDQLSKNKNEQSEFDSNDEENETNILLSSKIEVMFDEPFEGGLSDRSTKSNIFKMHASWLINISYGMRTSKKSINFKNIYQSIQPSKEQSNYQNNNYNINNNRGNFNVNIAQQVANNFLINQNQMTKTSMETNATNKTKSFNHSETSPFKALKTYANVRTQQEQMMNNEIETSPPLPQSVPKSITVEQLFNSVSFPPPPNERTTENLVENAQQLFGIMNIETVPTNSTENNEPKPSPTKKFGGPSPNNIKFKPPSAWVKNFSVGPSNKRQFSPTHHHKNQRQYHRTSTYQQPLNNQQSDSTRFVPLAVARICQHENALRKQNQFN